VTLDRLDGLYLRDGRERCRERSEAWTATQAQRLAVSPGDVLEAIKRGWLAEEVEALPCVSARKLAGKPPLRDWGWG